MVDQFDVSGVSGAETSRFERRQSARTNGEERVAQQVHDADLGDHRCVQVGVLRAQARLSGWVACRVAPAPAQQARNEIDFVKSGRMVSPAFARLAACC
jgi:hypothetical protein